MKWLLHGLWSLLALAVLAVAALYAWSGMIIDREYTAEPRKVSLSSRPEVLGYSEYGMMARILMVTGEVRPEAFSKLMATGVGLGDRDLGLMSKVAQYRFSHLTEHEVAALHAYLQTL